jgi:predicted TIM-barrel fold metal-dependent hydrolase
MIVDVHTHIFPPRMIEGRAGLAATDSGFGALYAQPKARMATAEELLASMDAAGVDVAVACGFWWQRGEHAAEHRAYLLDVATRAGGRILPFVPIASDEPTSVLDAAIEAGTRGLGELRAGATLDEATTDLVRRAGARGLAVLAHCSEEVGHAYAGKAGGLTAGGLWTLAQAAPETRLIAAHWGGGFPFYGAMPEVRAELERGRITFDTAAMPLLYEPRLFAAARALTGIDAVLWGSDFPLREQRGDRASIEAALTDDAERAAVLGGNAARLLDL